MAEYRIDELAQVSGSTVRNVRSYQERGLLPPPRREGRVGLYGDTHLARLQLIGRLLERGYTVNNIGELLTAWERGRDLGDVLGLEQMLSSFFSREEPQVFDRDALVAILTAAPAGGGPAAERSGSTADPDALVATAVRAGLATPVAPSVTGDARTMRYESPSPRLLNACADLVRAGVPAEVVLAFGAQLQHAVDDVARRFVGFMADYLFRGREPGWMPTTEEIPALEGFVDRIRPASARAVHAALGRALDRHVDAAFGEYIDRLTSHVAVTRASPDPA